MKINLYDIKSKKFIDNALRKPLIMTGKGF